MSTAPPNGPGGRAAASGIINATAALREWTPVRSKAFSGCLRTVLTAVTSMQAISALPFP